LSDEEIIRDVYPDEELERLTAKTIGTRSELLSVLAGVRRSQLAYSDEETLVGVWGVASPVRDISGAAVASIALGAVTYTLEEERRSSLEIIAKAANQLVSFQLGYVDSGTDVRTIEGLRELWQRSQSRERASIVRCEVSSARQSVDGVQM
jgi:DNA-binding IclR family transcriptional regulator